MSGPGRDKIGDYEMLESLGQGSRGRVFKARCTASGNPRVAKDQIVSIKVLHSPGQDARDAERFSKQAEVLCGLTHPNIIKYLDVFVWRPGEWDEVRCLVTELLEGETLEARIKKCPAGLEWTDVKSIFQQAAAALTFACGKGVLHKDLKPSNIFLTRDGAVKVFDFDIARKDQDGDASTAAWKGTFDYMAPDFLTVPGFRGDEQSDIFSFGICFFEALTGKVPFEPMSKGAHVAYLNRWHGSEKPPEPSFRAGVFRVLANARRFVERSIHPACEQRFRSFPQVEEELAKIHYRRIRHGDREEFELQAVLGRGGFGEVFFARRLRDGMKVAVKHLFAQKQSERFIREAKMIQRVEHPHICRYIDFFVIKTATEEQYYLVLEYLEGMPGWSLRYRIKKEGALPIDEVVPLFINYLKALQFLHEGKKPIIHRDIKPTNLYAPRGQPDKARIFDLGVARDVTGTVTYGGVPGTLDYMAPEFAKAGGDRGGPHSDLYSLGLCMYEAVTGKSAYEKLPTELNTAWVEFQKRAEGRQDLNFDAPVFKENPRLAAAIRKAMARNPEDRYASARQMIRDLELILGIGGSEEAATMVTSATSPSLEDMPSFDNEPTPHPSASPAPRGRESTNGSAARSPSAAAADLEASEEADEPFATRATRMDGPRGDGQNWAARHKAKKKLILWGGIAAAVVVLAVLSAKLLTGMPAKMARGEAVKIVEDLKQAEATAAYVDGLKDGVARLRSYADKYPQFKSEWRASINEVEGYGRRVPDQFKEHFAVAAVERKSDEVARLLAEWQQLAGAAGLMGLTVEKYEDRLDYMKRVAGKLQFEQFLSTIRQQLPENITGNDTLKQFEDVAMQYRSIAGRSWDGMSPDERKRQLDQVVGVLTNAALAYIAELTGAAEAKYARGEGADAERDAVKTLQARAPALVELVRPVYDASVQRVDAAQSATEGAREARQMLADIAAAGVVADLDPIVMKFDAWKKSNTGPDAATLARGVADALTARYRDFVMADYKQARADYDTLRIKEGTGHQKNVQVLLTLVPERFGRQDLQKLDVELSGLQKDAQARLEKAEAQKKQQALENQQKEAQATAAKKERDRQIAIAEAERQLAALQKKAAQGGPAQWKDAVKTLVEFDANMLRVASVKKVWDAAAAEYSTVIDAAVAQKEPLAERATRLDTLQQIFGMKGADAVFGAGLDGLRTKLAAQRTKFILRVANQAGHNLTLSSGDVLKKTVLAPAQRVDITLPATDVKTGAPFLIEGGEGYKPRTKVVALVGGGSEELALTSLEAVEPEKTTVPTAETQAADMGTFRITVSPKTARILLDEQEIQAGDITVSSDDNHKLHVEAPGYETYDQSYRVGAGKVKTIDILMTKEKKKSGFF
ncbi:MAG: protein kinase [bacterium]